MPMKMNEPQVNENVDGAVRRRRWLQLGVGAVAAAAGMAGAWWKFRPHDIEEGSIDQFWGLTLDTPTGNPFAMSGLKGKPVIINFWATWCPPCIEELPLLNSFYKQNLANGWQVVGVAVDQPSAVRSYLQKLPLDFPIVMAGLEGTELGRSMGNAAGGLPFSVVVSAKGEVIARKMGQIHADDLKNWSAST